MAEENRAERAGDHGRAEDGERRQQRGGLVARGEEQMREDEHCGCRVDVEVIKFDRGADQARENDARA